MSIYREAVPEEARNARDAAYAAAMRDICNGDLTYPRAVWRLRTQYGRVWREYELPIYASKREHDNRSYRHGSVSEPA